MDTNKNSYTILYAALMVVVVAAILAFASMSLKDRQQRNIDIETKKTILMSVDLVSDLDNQKDKSTYVENQYDKYIKPVIVNAKGEIVEGDAFKVNLSEQTKIIKAAAALEGDARAKALESVKLPLFICTMDNGSTVNIIPVYGAGLWGPIWGYVAVESDCETVYGATFAHKSETPGLGAEIATANFQSKFKGRKIFSDGLFTSVLVVKGGADPNSVNQVDAISGGTITSKALESAIRSWIECYLPYMNSIKTSVPMTEIVPAQEATQATETAEVK